jgi:hypothetical protein
VSLADLALLYCVVGLACAVAIYRSSTESRPRAAAAAALAVPLWPLWAPIALTSGKTRAASPAWATARERSPRSEVSDAAARIDAALREGVDACAGTSLQELLPRDAASRISAEVSRAAARHAELTEVLARKEFALESAERRVAELERAELERAAAAPAGPGSDGARGSAMGQRSAEPSSAPCPARALITARLHCENVRRLVALRDRDARALEELADLMQALRTQLVLARFAGSSVEGAGGIVSEVWARVEGLGAAMGGDDLRAVDMT